MSAASFVSFLRDPGGLAHIRSFLGVSSTKSCEATLTAAYRVMVKLSHAQVLCPDLACIQAASAARLAACTAVP